jgi:uncharacterized protein (TIGR03067 family)
LVFGEEESSMSVDLFLVSTACLLLTAQGANTDAIKQDLKKFRGTWVAVSTAIDGKKKSALDEQSFWIFDDDKLTSRLKDKPGSGGRVRLDPAKSPKAIDIDFTTPEGVTGTLVGIYQFNEDGTLWLAFDGRGVGRPASFSTTPGSGHRLIAFKKEDNNKGQK